MTRTFSISHLFSHCLSFALIMLALLAGCATPPESKGPDTAKPEADAAPEPVAPEPVSAPKRPQLTGQAARAEVQKILRQSFEWLDAGEEEKARTELEYARQLEPDNKQVACLYRGVTADPATTLGHESTPYTVRPGESLGTIARRAMGDVCEFYILARYNQIKVPKQLASGQTIRIPGKVALAAPTVAEPAPAPPVAAPKPEPAPVVVEPVKPKPPVISPEAEEKNRRAAIDRYHRNAQAAYRRQDLNTAIREWDAVLAIDPNNGLALARKQEALDLQRRLENLKK
jgi:tetratricopeptide (TPR) repeat protein